MVVSLLTFVKYYFLGINIFIVSGFYDKIMNEFCGCYFMVYEDKINNLNGKEWLKHSINFWTLEDLDRINF